MCIRDRCKTATVLVYCMAGNVSLVGLGEPMVEQRLLQGTDVALASLLVLLGSDAIARCEMRGGVWRDAWWLTIKTITITV